MLPDIMTDKELKKLAAKYCDDALKGLSVDDIGITEVFNAFISGFRIAYNFSHNEKKTYYMSYEKKEQ